MAKEFITAFGEAIVQNRRDYGQYDPVLLAELIGMTVSTIEVDDLTLLSLLAPARIGIPTDAIRGSKDTEGRQLAEAVWQKFPHLHGFLYPSRITTELCLMVYDRCASRLTTVDQTPLMRHHLLSHALDYYRLQLKV